MIMAHRIEKIDLLEWGWHKIGDPSKPKAFLWGNPDWPDFYLMYDELEGWAAVVYRYARGGSDECTFIEAIYRYMNTHKDYEHEWDD